MSEQTPKSSTRIVVTVLGQDQIGIIAAVTQILAAARANVVDISQTLMGSMFTMIMMVDTRDSPQSFDELKRQLNAKGKELGLQIDAQREDVFQFMHRI